MRPLLTMIALGAALTLASPAAAHQGPSEPPARISVPFDEWAAAGNRDPIDWEVYVREPRLGFDQRLELQVRIEVSAKALGKLGADHELYLMARLGDETGRWIAQGWLGNKLSRVLPNRAVVEFRLAFLVLPGDYTLAVVLYDDVTKLHNVHKQKVKAKPVKNDPLPMAFSKLPRALWLPPSSAFEALHNAGVQSRLDLPVQTDRPLHVEVVLLLGPLEQRGLKSGSPYSAFGLAVTAMHVLSQLRAADAAFHLTVLDPLRRQVVLQQKPAGNFDWEGLRESVDAVNPGVIAADALQGGRQNLLFLRDVLAERLAEPLAPVQGKAPLRVMLLIGSPIFLPRDTERAKLSPESVGDALLFQLRFFSYDMMAPSRRQRGSPLFGPVIGHNQFFADDVDAMMRPAKPTQFNVSRPEHLRAALAHLIRAIENHGQSGSSLSGSRSPL